ncbi:MAG TPA: addiction module protein [bacterium]|nr:addiction module protein [bacterium]HQL61674.1 addiction module protein [bacterium]
MPDELLQHSDQGDSLWAEEAERRLDELEQGRATELPAEEVLRRARAAVS